MDGYIRKTDFYTLTTVDTKNAYKMAKGMGDVSLMGEAARNSKIRYGEAYSMFKSMFKEMGDKGEALIRIIPRYTYITFRTEWSFLLPPLSPLLLPPSIS